MFGMYIIFGILLLLFILKEFFLDLGEEEKRKPKFDSKYTKIIYENPVTSALTINIVSLLISMYSVKTNVKAITFFLVMIGIVNGKILQHGTNLNKLKKAIIFLSIFLMISGFSLYDTHIHNIKANEILKSLQ